MAEVVSRNSEVILPQFEEIIKLELFSSTEMREIIRRHVEYEYRTAKREKQVTDFQEYIDYKTDFLKLIRIRMKVKSIVKKERKKLESMIVQHIGKLYKAVTKYYSRNTSVWLDYIDFLTKEKHFSQVTFAYESLLSIHMNNEELFVRAAKFFIKYVRDIDLSRKTLFKGIRVHKYSQLLHLEFFKIELEYAVKKRKELEDDSEILSTDPVLCGKTAEVICTSALRFIHDLNFKVSVLEVSAPFKFMKSFRKKIYRMLKNEHGNNIEMWKSIAQLQLNDINFEAIDMSSLKSRDPFKQKVWRCFHIYLKAVEAVPTKTTWYYFFDTLFDLLRSNPDKFDFIFNLILKILPIKNAHNLLEEECYLRLIEDSQRFYTTDKLIPLIESLLKSFPHNIDLWLKKLEYQVKCNNINEFQQMFNEALHNSKQVKDQYRLWQFVLNSSVDISLDKMNSVFEKAMRESHSPPILRSLYLDWMLSKKDINGLRSVSLKMLNSPPYDLELYKKVVKAELSQTRVDENQIRKLYNMMCFYFGASHLDVWLDFLEFEKLHGDVSRVTAIYWNAVKQLEPSLSDRFIANYSISKAM